MNESNNFTLQQWLYMFVVKSHESHNSTLYGGNAYLYKLQRGYMCCALLYAKPDSEWAEFAARHLFTRKQLPTVVLEQIEKPDVRMFNISGILMHYLNLFYYHNGDKDMKFNLFSLAQKAKKASDIANTAKEVTSDYRIDYQEGEDLSVFAQNQNISLKDRGMAMARAALNTDWFDLAKLGFGALMDLISKDPLPYEDFLLAISQYVDVKIQQFSMEENLKFVAGECALSVSMEQKAVLAKVQLYFKSSANKWIMKEVNGETKFHCFTKETLDGEITEILNEGGRKFPVTKPE